MHMHTSTYHMHICTCNVHRCISAINRVLPYFVRWNVPSCVQTFCTSMRAMHANMRTDVHCMRVCQHACVHMFRMMCWCPLSLYRITPHARGDLTHDLDYSPARGKAAPPYRCAALARKGSPHALSTVLHANYKERLRFKLLRPFAAFSRARES